MTPNGCCNDQNLSFPNHNEHRTQTIRAKYYYHNECDAAGGKDSIIIMSGIHLIIQPPESKSYVNWMWMISTRTLHSINKS